MNNVLKTAEKVLRTEAEAVLSLIPRLNGQFSKSVQMILACQGRVVITGMGKSGLICQKIAATIRITSYNVCYTKLLRSRPSVSPG